jgi:hypothetical protein
VILCVEKCRKYHSTSPHSHIWLMAPIFLNKTVHIIHVYADIALQYKIFYFLHFLLYRVIQVTQPGIKQQGDGMGFCMQHLASLVTPCWLTVFHGTVRQSSSAINALFATSAVCHFVCPGQRVIATFTTACHWTLLSHLLVGHYWKSTWCKYECTLLPLTDLGTLLLSVFTLLIKGVFCMLKCKVCHLVNWNKKYTAHSLRHRKLFTTE